MFCIAFYGKIESRLHFSDKTIEGIVNVLSHQIVVSNYRYEHCCRPREAAPRGGQTKSVLPGKARCLCQTEGMEGSVG